MTKKSRKRGQNFFRKFSKVSLRASEDSKEHLKENLFERFSHIANIKLLILEWGLLVGALIMLAVAQAFWFGDSYAEDMFTDGGIYTEATVGEVDSLNPLFATTSSERVMSRLMFATLATIDYSGHSGAGLAESILPSEDGQVWTVRMREGLLWSDGQPITSDDVVFTAELIKNPVVNSVYDSNLANVKVTKNENDEVVFTLPTPYADFTSALVFPVLPKHVLENVDPQTLAEDSFSTAPVTSGAFALNATQTDSLTNETVFYLSANPNYYKGTPMLGSFAIHTYDNAEKVIEAIKAGTVTATAELSNADSTAVTSGQFIAKESNLNSGVFMFFNTASEKMRNKDLRVAIRQGIDIDKIRAIADGTSPLDYPLLESQIELENYPEMPTRDFVTAKNTINDLLEGSEAQLEIATIKTGYLPDVTTAIADELDVLGLKTNVTVYEENQEFISNVIAKRNYDILVYEVELGSEPDLLPYYHSSQASVAGLNLSNYKNSLVDDLLLGARDTLDENLRAKKYETFLEYWGASVPAIGLYQSNLTYYYNRNVRTFGNDVRLVTALDRFVDVTNWAVAKETKNRTP